MTAVEESEIIEEVKVLLREGKRTEEALIQLKKRLIQLSRDFGLSINLDDWQLK